MTENIEKLIAVLRKSNNKTLLPMEPLKPYEQRWANALKLADLSEADQSLLMPAAKTMSDMSTDVMLVSVNNKV